MIFAANYVDDKSRYLDCGISLVENNSFVFDKSKVATTLDYWKNASVVLNNSNSLNASFSFVSQLVSYCFLNAKKSNEVVNGFVGEEFFGNAVVSSGDDLKIAVSLNDSFVLRNDTIGFIGSFSGNVVHQDKGEIELFNFYTFGYSFEFYQGLEKQIECNYPFVFVEDNIDLQLDIKFNYGFVNQNLTNLETSVESVEYSIPVEIGTKALVLDLKDDKVENFSFELPNLLEIVGSKIYVKITFAKVKILKILTNNNKVFVITLKPYYKWKRNLL